jgi:hypothetical protein
MISRNSDDVTRTYSEPPNWAPSLGALLRSDTVRRSC